MAEASQPAKVRLEISFKDAGQKKRFPEEEVTGVTAKGYEIVEAAGLVFRRRSKSLRTAAATPAASTPGAAPMAEAEAADAAATDPASDAEMEVDDSPAAQPSQEPAPGEASQQQPAEQQESGTASLDSPSPADEQQQQQQAQEALSAVPEAAQESQRLAIVCSRVAEAALTRAELGGGEGAQRLVASLQAVLARFRAGVEAAQQEGTLVCEEQAAPPPLDAAGTSAQERAAIEGRLQSYQSEEAAWAAILEAQPGAPAPAAALEAGGPAAPGEGVPSLGGARDVVHQKMAFQVECLCSMIATVEEMVALAELQCGEMQAEYHREKFRAFPHVDSPARLIHEIVRARASLFQAVPMRVG